MCAAAKIVSRSRLTVSTLNDAFAELTHSNTYDKYQGGVGSRLSMTSKMHTVSVDTAQACCRYVRNHKKEQKPSDNEKGKA
jgi:hypothetical protein